MQFSESWLKSLVDPKLGTRELAHLLTMAGLEVEALESVAAPFNQVVVAQILSAGKHPDADRLQICKVDVGEADPLTIVCGAANARAGLKTACARIGAHLPGLQIRQAKVRGVESFGMLCSAKELGIAQTDAADGILELSADAPPGMDLRDWLNLDDTRITLKLTPNRGDCLSVHGIAREVAALSGQAMNAPDCSPVSGSTDEVFPVAIEASDACPRYCGRVIRGIDPAAVTPGWMLERLERSGVRPIHPVVDVTNYVMLELGQPMHGFDLARLRSGIKVRFARDGEQMTLLNGQVSELRQDSLIIADDNGPLALAGIMGGQGSGVGDASRDIFLEAAHFMPDAVAGRARRHGLSTDSSHRFERGVDPELPMQAMERATRLVLMICGGQAGPVTMTGPGVPARTPIPFSPGRARKLLGLPLEDAPMLGILTRLGMVVEAVASGYRVDVPSHRFDLIQEVDLIEEVARVHGYDAIPAIPLRGNHALAPVAEGVRDIGEIRNLMVARGYQEVIAYSFISAEMDRDFRTDESSLMLLNPISNQMGVMRSSLLPGLIQTLRYNLNHGQERLRLFEIGRAFLTDRAMDQPRRLAGLAYGSASPEQWGNTPRGVDLHDLLGDVEALFHPVRLQSSGGDHPALHPGQSARLRLNGEHVGWIGSLHPRLAQKHGFPKSPILFELDLIPLIERPVPVYGPVPRQPTVRRDLSVVVDQGLPAGRILAVLQAEKPPSVSDIELFDVYQGPGVEAGKKSLAFKMLLQHTDKTLTETEIDELVREVLDILKTNFHARQRS